MIAAALAFLSGTLAAAGLVALAPVGARRPGGALPLRLLLAAGEALRRRLALPASQDLAARLDAAGRPGGLGERELMAAKVGAAAGCGALGFALAASAPGRLGTVLAVGSPVGGFLAPDLWLARRAAERARRARRELPAMLDLLRVTVEAGASLPTALTEVGHRASGPLAREWRAVGRQAALGMPLGEALEEMATRLPLPEVVVLVAAIERSRRHGSPLAGTLAAQARGSRQALRRRVQEEGARAGPKIQLVVAALLVPSVLLLVAAALATALLDPATDAPGALGS